MDTKGGEYSFLVRGFPIGFVTPTEHEIHYLYNHHIITVNYHEDPEHFEGARVVGVEVDVRSVKHQLDAEGNVVTCEGLNSNAAEQQFNFQSVEEPGQVRLSGRQCTTSRVWVFDAPSHPPRCR
eukprot:scaffold1130_cov195-Pinguiococcus_pyrenoidosus.AAC.82